MQVKNENLSIIMQKVNSRYSMYFNHKYKRVGPLWQGRFKSWCVYDEDYLQTLVRYIEFNPIKANITKKIGEYKWAMLSRNVEFLMLNYELIDVTDFTKFGGPFERHRQFAALLYGAPLIFSSALGFIFTYIIYREFM